MNWLLILNNLTSAGVVLTCWWLAHSNSRGIYPGRLVAALYSMMGLSVLLTGIVRNLTISLITVPWLIVITKALLSIVLLLEVYRRERLRRMVKNADIPPFTERSKP